VTRTDLVRYAGAGGDFNPIHHDDEFAREAGLPSVFGMGFFHAGLLARQVADWLGLANVRSYEVRFAGQVWPGDVLKFEGAVERAYELDGERLIECTFQVLRDVDEVVATATATATAGVDGLR
jgi:acyl dehydratase